MTLTATLASTILTLESSGGVTATVDLSGLPPTDDADADPANELNTDAALLGTTLVITDAGESQSVNLSALQDGVNDADASPTNELNTGAALMGTTLVITDAGGGQSVDLGVYLDNTDAQTLTLNGTDLNVSGSNSVDLSSLQGSGSGPSNVLWVAKNGGDYTSLQTALDSITNASEYTPYLVRVAPGVYTETVTMKPYVDIEGSGEGITTIVWTGGSASTSDATTITAADASASATLTGTTHAELRSLTVKSVGQTGPNDLAVGIFNITSTLRLLHVTVVAEGNVSSSISIFISTGSAITVENATINAGDIGIRGAGTSGSRTEFKVRNSIVRSTNATSFTIFLNDTNAKISYSQ